MSQSTGMKCLLFLSICCGWRPGPVAAQVVEPDWSASAPSQYPAAYMIDSRPSRRIKAILTNDIYEPNGRVAIWELMAPEAPTLPGQRDVTTRLTPGGRPGKELSLLQRPLLVSRTMGNAKMLHTQLIIEATLYARRLVPCSPGQGPAVADLHPVVAALYTRASQTMDFQTRPFPEWMKRNGLWRTDDEDDVAFARRIFQVLKDHLEYVDHADDVRASYTCRVGEADCAGQSCLFVAVLRANGIPARLLQGRWAASEKPVETYGETHGRFHVKSEFFARGVGWVPVDLSAASQDNSPDQFAFFGNDPGDFLVMNIDQDLILNSAIAGKCTAFGLQRIRYWWQGSGSTKGERTRESWTVEDQDLP